MSDEVTTFEVDVSGRRLRCELNGHSYVDVAHAFDDAPAQPMFRAMVTVGDDGVTLAPQTWKGAPQPDAFVLEHVAGAVRERAVAWGPPVLWSDYDWPEVFRVALERGAAGVEGYTGSVEPFGIADVAEVLATANGENDGASWVGAFRLRDGRFAYVDAGCDYTGWG